MSTLSVSLSDDLQAKVEARAAEAGYTTPADYIEALIVADVDAQLIDCELEAKLLMARQSPEREISTQDWDAKRHDLAARTGASRS